MLVRGLDGNSLSVACDRRPNESTAERSTAPGSRRSIDRTEHEFVNDEYPQELTEAQKKELFKFEREMRYQ